MYVLFLYSPRKVPKESDLRGHSEKACPLKKPLRRLASRCPKMFRFLNTYNSKACKAFPGRHPKIGTFSGVGWRCGGGFQRGRIFVAPLWLISLVTFLFSDKKVTSLHLRLQKAIGFCALSVSISQSTAGRFKQYFV